MSRKGAIEYISYAGAVGYGTAAVGYVRLLVEAGFEVHWMPYPGDAIGSGRVGDGIGDAELSRGRAGLIARSVAGAEAASSRWSKRRRGRSTPASASSTSCRATGFNT